MMAEHVCLVGWDTEGGWGQQATAKTQLVLAHTIMPSQ